MRFQEVVADTVRTQVKKKTGDGSVAFTLNRNQHPCSILDILFKLFIAVRGRKLMPIFVSTRVVGGGGSGQR